MIVAKALERYPQATASSATLYRLSVRESELVVEKGSCAAGRGPSEAETGRPGGAAETQAYRMGMMIGRLERALVLTLVLFGQWGALGLVLAAKSIARFRELESQGFSDYYLIGTLWSILIAVVTAIITNAAVS